MGLLPGETKAEVYKTHSKCVRVLVNVHRDGLSADLERLKSPQSGGPAQHLLEQHLPSAKVAQGPPPLLPEAGTISRMHVIIFRQTDHEDTEPLVSMSPHH